MFFHVYLGLECLSNTVNSLVSLSPPFDTFGKENHEGGVSSYQIEVILGQVVVDGDVELALTRVDRRQQFHHVILEITMRRHHQYDGIENDEEQNHNGVILPRQNPP